LRASFILFPTVRSIAGVSKIGHRHTAGGAAGWARHGRPRCRARHHPRAPGDGDRAWSRTVPANRPSRPSTESRRRRYVQAPRRAHPHSGHRHAWTRRAGLRSRDLPPASAAEVR